VTRVDIVGLGPGPAAFVTGATLALLRSGRPILVGDERAQALTEALDPTRPVVRARDSAPAPIVEQLTTLAAGSGAIYAVQGSPLRGSVVDLVPLLEAAGCDAHLHPALELADLALALLAQDRTAVQIVSGSQHSRFDPQRPALFVASDQEERDPRQPVLSYPADHEVVVLTGITSRPQLSTRAVSDTELAHSGSPAPFDAVFVPAIAPEHDLRRFDGLENVIRRLHSPDGCPWDREQTHQSLRSHLLEESYELLEAIDSGEVGPLIEELGDVLLQVLMHAAVAERLDEFELRDVIEAISSKLVARHPHVFAGGSADSAEEVRANWEALKRKERPGHSVLAGVPSALPALAEAQTLQGRASRSGFDWPDVRGPLDKLAEEIGELALAETPEEQEDEFGDVLFAIANLSQRMGIDGEQALRRANQKFRRRFGAVEHWAREAGDELHDLSLDDLNALWDRAKAGERAQL